MHSEQSQSGRGTILERSRRCVVEGEGFGKGVLFMGGLSILGRGESHTSHCRAFGELIRVHEGQDHSYECGHQRNSSLAQDI